MPERVPLRPRHVTRPNGAEQIEVPQFGANMRLDACLARFGEGRSRFEPSYRHPDTSISSATSVTARQTFSVPMWKP